jgi:hypothetical protein
MGGGKMRNDNSVPDHLITTHAMLSGAFPDIDHLTETDYHVILKILMEHMSHRNIVDVMAALVPKHPAFILNDVYRTFHMHFPDQDIVRITQELEKHGYAAWLAEEA